MTPEYSVVVPVMNLAHSVELFLRCLENQDFPRERWECILVDDGSADGTLNAARSRERAFSLRVIAHPVNLGRSQARNTGWRNSLGDMVIFIDGDMLPAPGWLRGYHEAARAAPHWDALSGARHCIPVANGEGVRSRLAHFAGAGETELFETRAAAQFDRIHARAALGQYPSPLFDRLERELRDVCRLMPASLLCGYSFVTSNVAVRRARLEAARGFDPFLRRGEDTDLGLRLWEQGAAFGFADQARAYHLYDARQPDRNTSPVENLAFFYRHPYTLVALVHLWCANALAAKARPDFELPARLADLARVAQSPLRGNLERQVAMLFAQASPASSQFPQDFLAAYFAEAGGGSVDEVSRHLDDAVRGGLIAFERNGRRFLDMYHAGNWLRYRTRYEEFCLEHSSYARTHKTPYQIDGRAEGRAQIEYCGVYEVELPAGIVEHGGAALNLALPVQHPHQTDVRITGCWPPDLLDYADHAKGMIAGYPMERRALRVGYSFTCRVSECGVSGAGAPDAFVQPAWTAEHLEKARALLGKIGGALNGEPLEKARAIYRWIMDHTFYYESPFPDFFCLDTGFGSCVHQSALFVNLCRLAGIPARERRGALLSKRCGDEIETRTRGFSPFVHTWAEFHVAQGWTPVDFVGWGYGKRLMTARNVADPALRSELERDTSLFDAYYFGNLDPYRIYCSEVAGQFPCYRFVSGMAKGATPAWRQQMLSETRHALRCRIASSNLEDSIAAAAALAN